MLKQITDNVFVHQSDFLQSNAVIVRGMAGALLVDPGITNDEMAELARDLRDLNLPVAAGYSTHPHWDHLLWRSNFGDAPRYGTARNEADIKAFLSNPDWKTQVALMLPAEIAEQIPMDNLFGEITGLSAGTTYIPWDGPKVRIIEYGGHAPGSAALLIEEPGVLVAGDMLSDILIPFLELDAPDPIGDYLTALQMFEDEADKVKIVIPGHGSVGDANEFRARIGQDRTYVQALRGDGGAGDARLTAGPQKELLSSVHARQAELR